eukprot:CAMPEP_0205925762 /NCGR_PEP_ID=MMETSP1325-20131115/18863_1 /ASSEMBLY_ACC=CAM_ASM_000708 /TAXON_ID=236786 /ORGANISM="Florenciella sp., Strain RCC1007" /LENGTH=57 /DNA_ID=CAMNT_0053294345 /DNA_START=78 /DNA_END=248 /DNA_ORIENTATION=+
MADDSKNDEVLDEHVDADAAKDLDDEVLDEDEPEEKEGEEGEVEDEGEGEGEYYEEE